MSLLAAWLENHFNGSFEELGDGKGQWETRIVLPRLDGVHRLPRDAQSFGQLALRPRPFGPEYPEPIVHSYFRLTAVIPATQNRNIAIQSHGYALPNETFGSTPNLTSIPHPITSNAVAAN